MKGLVLPTGALIGPDLIAQLKADGCEGIRQTAKQVSGEDALALAQEILNAGMQPYLSCNRLDQIQAIPADSGILLGWINEPDLNHCDPEDYTQSFEDLIPIAMERNLRIYAGEVSNLNERGFAYLRKLPWHRWPVSVVGCAYHRYPETSGPLQPHKPSRTRHDEMETLRQIVGFDRPLLRGEVGYNNLDFSEADAARYMVVERDFDVGEGVDWTFAYEGPDGPDPHSQNVEDHYGFWRSDGFQSKKPVYFSFFG